MSNEEILKRLEAAEQSAQTAMENCEEIGALQSARELGAVIDRIQELKESIKTEQEAQ